jgi:putative secretion ATPase (PEP-CTERM system associated)
LLYTSGFSAVYESFYKLNQNPFRLNADPDFFFTSAVHSRAMDYLRYGVKQGEGFIVITGAPGLGKTMLVKALCEELRDQKIIVGQLLTTQLGADDIIRIVAGTFGLAHQGLTKAALLNVLERYFLSKVRRGKRILLVVDEAHHLSVQAIEELRLLMNFEDQGRPLFQCFLLGQEPLKSTLQLPELEQARQRVMAAHHLRALDLDETQQYIEHRLSQAGWSGNPSFDDDAFSKIHEFSNGIPRRINLVCNRTLAYGFLEELDILNGAAVEFVLTELREEAIGEAPQVRQVENNVINFDRGIDARIKRLELKVDAMKESMRKERRLLRKALLLNLDVKTDELDDKDHS